MHYKMKISVILFIGLCHYIYGQKTNSFILPDEAVNHVWRTTDSDAVIFDHQSTTQASHSRDKVEDSLHNSCGIKEMSVASVFLLISAIIVN